MKNEKRNPEVIDIDIANYGVMNLFEPKVGSVYNFGQLKNCKAVLSRSTSCGKCAAINLPNECVNTNCVESGKTIHWKQI